MRLHGEIRDPPVNDGMALPAGNCLCTAIGVFCCALMAQLERNACKVYRFERRGKCTSSLVFVIVASHALDTYGFQGCDGDGASRSFETGVSSRPFRRSPSPRVSIVVASPNCLVHQSHFLAALVSGRTQDQRPRIPQLSLRFSSLGNRATDTDNRARVVPFLIAAETSVLHRPVGAPYAPSKTTQERSRSSWISSMTA